MGLIDGRQGADNDTAAGRQENRRVEVAIYASEEYRQRVQNRAGL